MLTVGVSFPRMWSLGSSPINFFHNASRLNHDAQDDLGLKEQNPSQSMLVEQPIINEVIPQITRTSVVLFSQKFE